VSKIYIHSIQIVEIQVSLSRYGYGVVNDTNCPCPFEYLDLLSDDKLIISVPLSSLFIAI
jgi:hypothetical protein